MATTQDLNILRYGVADGHQPQSQPLQSAVSVYIGQLAITRSGYLIQPDTSVASTDIAWGVINGQDNSQHTISSPIAGGTVAGLHILGIDTGSFYFSVGLSSDALTQADVGATVYAIDGNTVGKTDGGAARPVAGKLASIGVGQYAGLVAVTVGNDQSTGSP
jgi:hypothetical protein